MEMCFPNNGIGMNIDLSEFAEEDLIKILFAENAGVVVQVETSIHSKRKLKNKVFFTKF